MFAELIKCCDKSGFCDLNWVSRPFNTIDVLIILISIGFGFLLGALLIERKFKKEREQ